mgnify:CR=1 FL=1
MRLHFGNCHSIGVLMALLFLSLSCDNSTWPSDTLRYFNLRGQDLRRKLSRMEGLFWSNFNPFAAARAATGDGSMSLLDIIISIHAAARAATPWCWTAFQAIMISIHAAARAATRRIKRIWTISGISIHAAARAATQSFDSDGLNLLFQSTQPRGLRRDGRSRRQEAMKKFQSTQPRGLRRFARLWMGNGFVYFNPRSREGCDASCIETVRVVLWFQSTQPRGLRHGGSAAGGHASKISIHAAARAATWEKRICVVTCRFQSTQPRGLRRAWQVPHTAGSRFQSTQPRGLRLCGIRSDNILTYFNPRSREGCDLRLHHW